MAENEVQVAITIDEQQALQALTRLTQNVDNFAKSTQQSVGKADLAFASFAGNLASQLVIKGFEAVRGGINAVGDAIKVFIDKAAASQDATNALNTSLALSGKFSTQSSNDFKKFAEQMQNTTKYSDDMVETSAALIENMAHLSETDLVRATKAAADMASTFNMDLETASRKVGSALEGNVSTLNRYGVSVKQGKTEAENFSIVLGALENKFKGVAQSAGGTFSGSMTILKNQFEGIEKTIGSLFINSPELTKFFSAVSDGVMKLGEILNQNKAFFQALVNDGINYFIKGIQGMITIVDFTIGMFGEMEKVLPTLAEWYDRLATGINVARLALTGHLQAAAAETVALNERIKLIEAEKDAIDKRTQTYQHWFSQVTASLQNINTNERRAATNSVTNETKKNAELKKLSDKEALEHKQSVWDQMKWDTANNDTKIQNAKTTAGAISGLMASQNATLFFIGQQAAVANTVMSTSEAFMKTMAFYPYPFNLPLAGLVAAAGAVQVANIEAQQPPHFASGGIVPGSSYAGDNVTAMVNSGEMILNRSQQSKLFSIANGQGQSGSDVVKAIGALADKISNMQIVVKANAREIARSVRDERIAGFAI